MLIDKVAYIYSTKLEDLSNSLPIIRSRASIVHDLIQSYNILSNEQIVVVESADATVDELKLFHASSYVDMLEKSQNQSDVDHEELSEFGLNYDCPLLERTFDFAKTIGGSSLTGAKLLAEGKCRTVINWFGGWHHAQRDSASGFCYVNDVVLAIQKLSEKFNKILYVDLDVHHGDGVENAFALSRKIVTLSFHKCMPGFFPGTGNIDDCGLHKGRYYALNVPFLNGVNDNSFKKAFDEIFPSFNPTVLVVQCGADSLNGDVLGEGNLTLKGIGHCVEKVLAYGVPTLFLGGGGYNFPNAARLWTYLTSLIIGINLDNDIPDTSKYFSQYVPTYELHIEQSRTKDLNNDLYVNKLIKTISNYCNYIKE